MAKIGRAQRLQEWRQASPAELNDKIRQLQSEFFHLRLAAKQAKLEKPHQVKVIRHDIARLLTVLNEKAAHPR